MTIKWVGSRLLKIEDHWYWFFMKLFYAKPIQLEESDILKLVRVNLH